MEDGLGGQGASVPLPADPSALNYSVYEFYPVIFLFAQQRSARASCCPGNISCYFGRKGRKGRKKKHDHTFVKYSETQLMLPPDVPQCASLPQFVRLPSGRTPTLGMPLHCI